MRPRPGQNEERGVGGGSVVRGAAAAIAANLLNPVPAWAAEASFLSAETVAGAIAVGATALALATAVWALAEHGAASRLRHALSGMLARRRAETGMRDALLQSGREGLVVWGREGTAPAAYRGGDALLDACLSGPDATDLSEALDALSARGESFVMPARTEDGRQVAVRGRAVAGAAAVWLDAEPEGEAGRPDIRAILDALPLPVWLRDRTLALVWGNKAFLQATNTPSIEAARASGIGLDKSERELAALARTNEESAESKRYVVLNGERRALAFTHVPLADGSVVGTARDVTDLASAEARLQQHIDAHADTLDRLATAVAIFGKDKRLVFHNRAYEKLWGLPEEWLESRPAEEEILDRLREARKLPEQRDFQAWKRERLALYERTGEHVPEELWHTPGGKALRVVAQPHPFGGLTYLYEDVTDQIALESSLNTLNKVQRTTLDTLQEAVAVFGPDGRLKLYNAAFARVWELSPEALAGEPHLTKIAGTCNARFGAHEIWDSLIEGVTSAEIKRREWAEVHRADETVFAVTLAPLPDAATLISFVDVTDRFRVEKALRQRNEALEAADRLKSDFVKHVSYELRTPLNTILGYAELLEKGFAGLLSEKQRDAVGAIATASNRLRSLINDILVLAEIESGGVKLELDRIDLHALLSNLVRQMHDAAAKVGLNMVLDCPDGAGAFIADEKRVRQALFNLLSNAFKYTPKGGVITLGGRVEGDEVRIAVTDTGPGIAPDVKASVFDPFTAKHQSGQRGGAGLGLALVKRFVEMHQGWVELDSAPGRGTRVVCHFPRRPPERGTAPAREDDVAVTGAQSAV